MVGNTISNEDQSVPSPENSKTHIAIPDIVALLSKKAGIVKNNDQTWHQANKAYLWNKALQLPNLLKQYIHCLI